MKTIDELLKEQARIEMQLKCIHLFTCTDVMYDLARYECEKCGYVQVFDELAKKESN